MCKTLLNAPFVLLSSICFRLSQAKTGTPAGQLWRACRRDPGVGEEVVALRTQSTLRAPRIDEPPFQCQYGRVRKSQSCLNTGAREESISQPNKLRADCFGVVTFLYLLRHRHQARHFDSAIDDFTAAVVLAQEPAIQYATL